MLSYCLLVALVIGIIILKYKSIPIKEKPYLSHRLKDKYTDL